MYLFLVHGEHLAFSAVQIKDTILTKAVCEEASVGQRGLSVSSTVTTGGGTGATKKLGFKRVKGSKVRVGVWAGVEVRVTIEP